MDFAQQRFTVGSAMVISHMGSPDRIVLRSCRNRCREEWWRRPRRNHCRRHEPQRNNMDVANLAKARRLVFRLLVSRAQVVLHRRWWRHQRPLLLDEFQRRNEFRWHYMGRQNTSGGELLVIRHVVSSVGAVYGNLRRRRRPKCQRRHEFRRDYMDVPNTL